MEKEKIICPNCNFNIEIIKTNKNFKTNKEDLKNYPDCFDNFNDCPTKPINISQIPERCKICPHYQYSDYRQELINPDNITKQKRKLLKEFSTLKPEQQQKLLEILKNEKDKI
jgi:hypothetical protein